MMYYLPLNVWPRHLQGIRVAEVLVAGEVKRPEPGQAASGIDPDKVGVGSLAGDLVTVHGAGWGGGGGGLTRPRASTSISC